MQLLEEKFPLTGVFFLFFPLIENFSKSGSTALENKTSR